jgi:hypothetical protein
MCVIEDENTRPPPLIPRENVAAFAEIRKNGAQILFVLHRHSGDIEPNMDEGIFILYLSGIFTLL